MYKKAVAGLLTSSLVLSVFILPAKAQEATNPPTASPEPTESPFNFEKAYKDYVFTLDVYNRTHSEYQLARAQYLQAQTLASNAKAREATAAMLIARDDVMIVYLRMIIQRLAEAIGVDDTTKSGLSARLQSEITWFQNHKDRIDSAGSLEDLAADSEDAAKHYVVTEPLTYEVLVVLPTGRVSNARKSFTEVLNSLKQKTSSIRLAGDHDVTLAERWLIETDNKLTRSIDKENDAQTELQKIISTDPQQQRANKVPVYNQVLFRLDESLQFLREASGYTKEVLKQLKTKN